MTTPEQARKMAEYQGKEDLPCHVRDALRELADKVEELQADTRRLQCIQLNLKYDGPRYRFPEWCLIGESLPTLDEFRSFIDSQE